MKAIEQYFPLICNDMYCASIVVCKVARQLNDRSIAEKTELGIHGKPVIHCLSLISESRCTFLFFRVVLKYVTRDLNENEPVRRESSFNLAVIRGA